MKIINYKNIEWIILKESNDSKLLITKDILPKEIMKELTDIDSCYIPFDENNNNEYETSNLRKVINKFVDKYLDKRDLIEFGYDYARPLGASEILKYDNELMKCNDWYWTKTKVKGTSSLVWDVNLSGNLYLSNADDGDYGVRPVIRLKSNISTEEEKKIPEKIPLNYADDRKPEEVYEYLRCSYNQLIDYLKSKGE